MKARQVAELIRSDLFRYTEKLSLKLFLRNYFLNRSFHYSFWLRICKSGSLVPKCLARLMHMRLTRKYGIKIPPQTQIGYGLYLGHGQSLIVNGSCRIGNNCDVSQFTTIGSNNNHAARIGDNVYIGPNVCIVEDVHIGANATIGAGAVVVKDVSENATVAGVPEKVISYKSLGRYSNKRWEPSAQF